MQTELLRMPLNKVLFLMLDIFPYDLSFKNEANIYIFILGLISLVPSYEQ